MPCAHPNIATEKTLAEAKAGEQVAYVCVECGERGHVLPVRATRDPSPGYLYDACSDDPYRAKLTAEPE